MKYEYTECELYRVTYSGNGERRSVIFASELDSTLTVLDIAPKVAAFLRQELEEFDIYIVAIEEMDAYGWIMRECMDNVNQTP